MDRILRKIEMMAAAMYGTICFPLMTAFALPPVDSDVSPDDFDNVTVTSLTGWIIGFTMWVLRLSGIICTVWGIYELVTCRKDGDADGINIGIVKFAIGLVLIAAPSILKSLQIIK